MTTQSVSAFVAHASDDETIAVLVKALLEDTFPNATVFVAGPNLRAGSGWFEQLRQQLDQSAVIIVILTPRSKRNPWVLFEAGAGFCRQKTVPLLGDGLTFQALEAPLNELQGRLWDSSGLRSLIDDFARLTGQARTPTNLPDLDPERQSVL